MARLHSCIVFQPGKEIRNLWQFSNTGQKFVLQRHESKLAREPLPEKLVAKDWQNLFRARLNIAWLPADKVFVRVVQLPQADLAETRSMLELQLEKLSPLPVAQVVWGFELISTPIEGMQTAIVIVVARSHVEEFLNLLEGQGYLADRLDVPFLDQLRNTRLREDGAWIYPGVGGDPCCCLVAWWYGQTLQNICLVRLPTEGNREAVLHEQLAQMIWAGELEGWLTSAPHFYLLADEQVGAQWQQLLGSEHQVEVVPPIPEDELAALTARRAAVNSASTNLLPPEYTARYHQRFIDRLWMRGLGAVLMIYIGLVAIYLGWVQFTKWQHGRVESQIAALSQSYTNTMQLRDRMKVLQDQVDLQTAALDCWKAVAEHLPAGLTLRQLQFDQGRKLTLLGLASSENVGKVQDFNNALSKVEVKNQRLFSKVNAPLTQTAPGGANMTWSFSCELKRTE